MRGIFITFEGTEAAGKSTQITLLAKRLREQGCTVLCLREPGGTKIGEEIRHTLQHSQENHGMTAETELLLMNASRAQLVRETIRPALQGGQIVLCDRFYDSTVAYQEFGRQLPHEAVSSIIEFAVGTTKPDLTILLRIPASVSRKRRELRRLEQDPVRDRMEEEQEAFFARVEAGFQHQFSQHPDRVKSVDGQGEIDQVHEAIWHCVYPLLPPSASPSNPSHRSD